MRWLTVTHTQRWHAFHGTSGTGPIEFPEKWTEWVNQPQTAAEVAAIKTSIKTGSPFGSDTWIKRTAKWLQLESTLKPRGRSSLDGTPND